MCWLPPCQPMHTTRARLCSSSFSLNVAAFNLTFQRQTTPKDLQYTLLARHTMAESTHNATSIPQYLRYKVDVAEIDETERSEAKLEKANRIVHERLLRMRRDKLCADCSRFDFKRTRMYSRDVSCCYACRSQKIWKDYEDSEEDTWGKENVRFHVQDTVPWHIYETAPGASEEVQLLASHPRLAWWVGVNRSSTCTFCSTARNCFTQLKNTFPNGRIHAFIVMHEEEDDSRQVSSSLIRMFGTGHKNQS